MKGRKPLPTEMLLLQKEKLYGEQKERAENAPEALRIVDPTCPQYFRPSEKEAWEFLSRILKNYSLHVDINAPLLELAAIYLADFRNSQWELIKRGKTIRGVKGKNKKNPAIGERNASAERLIKILAELNMSASGVARLGAVIAQGRKNEFFED